MPINELKAMCDEKIVKTLTQVQDFTLQLMMAPRSSERRAEKMRAAALRQYRKEAAALGYTAKQIEMQVKDLRDIYQLRIGASL